MSIKKYILPTNEVGCVAQAASLQEAKIILEKDSKSSFYIMQLEDSVSLPANLHILECKQEAQPEPPAEPASNNSDDGNMLDLHLRFHLPPGLDREHFESALQSKISQAIESIIKEDDQPEE